MGHSSDTWFELTVDGPDGERVRVAIANNLQETYSTEHRVVIEDERVLGAALGGDRVSVWALSRRHGRINTVDSAEIGMYVAY